MMPPDPLSDVFTLLDARSVFSVGLRTGGDWSIAFPPVKGIKVNAVVAGSCWLTVEAADPVRLVAGDCFLLSQGRPFVLASDPELPPVRAEPVFAGASDGVVRYGDNDDTFILGGRVDVDAAESALLIDALPPVVVVHGAAPEAVTIRWILDRLAGEVGMARPGRELIAAGLVQAMFIEALRHHLNSGDTHEVGWFAAMRDGRIAAALAHLHGDPARRWSVSELAGAVGMSRSGFALRFKELLGTSPLDYLLQWRIRLAAKRLRSGTDSIAAVGFALGYETESGFSSAFKRVTGMAPRLYRLERTKPEAS